MHFKRYIILSLFIACFCFTPIIDSYAEQDTSFHCGTDPKLVQKLHQELVEKKLSELNADHSPWDSEISLFSIPFGVMGKHYMPSTGDVKALVLPIEFKDEKLSKDITSHLQQIFFDKQDIDNVAYKDLSVCDYFSAVSSDKLKLSGMVLPIYTATENREYYEDSTILIQEIAKAINQNKTILGDLSEYDYNNDGYIDCLNVIWAGGCGGWASTWWGALHAGPSTDLYNDKKIRSFIGVAEVQADNYTLEHEIGHALGLPDNYEVTSDSCILNNGVYELMQGNGYYINVFYKYLLDWEEPEMLLYKDINSTIDLYASDIHNNGYKAHT